MYSKTSKYAALLHDLENKDMALEFQKEMKDLSKKIFKLHLKEIVIEKTVDEHLDLCIQIDNEIVELQKKVVI